MRFLSCRVLRTICWSAKATERHSFVKTLQPLQGHYTTLWYSTTQTSQVSGSKLTEYPSEIKRFRLDKEEMLMVQVIRLNHLPPLLREGVPVSPHYLGREDHAGLAKLDLQRPQVGPAHGGAFHCWDLGQVLQQVPLSTVLPVRKYFISNIFSFTFSESPDFPG